MWRYRIADEGIWPRRQDAEYSVSSMCHMLRIVCGAQWAPVEVHFEHIAPADIKPYQRMFRAGAVERLARGQMPQSRKTGRERSAV